MPVTKEQWQKIERELSRDFGRVQLQCDGYQVMARIQAIAPLRQGIVVYVNGWVSGEWMRGEAEQARKFHRPMKRYLYGRKYREEAKKKARSRRLPPELRQFWSRNADAHVTVWVPYWPNARAFCRHLRKTCGAIELLKIGYGD